MYQVYGIRHHGPGSARSLLRGLAEQQPDCLLIEAPQDAEPVLAHIQHPKLRPPVAVLIYNPKELSQAAYLPFAHFSPEWQAAQFGLAQGIPVRFMDLPMGMQFQMKESAAQLELALPEEEQGQASMRDPMGYMASLAGYTDSERWWEATFEQPAHEQDVFEAIISLNSALRDELKREEQPMNRLREAYMRKQVRQALKEGFKRIAIVCGAWHSPALHYMDRFKPAADNALLKGLKKAKVTATWIPWGYRRLAFQSGYRSGVVSPAYYELLFEQREEVVQHWMAKTAALLREEGFAASAAQAVDAARLAKTLAQLRQQPLAGIAEMKEAALAVFCEGETVPLSLIEQKLIIGEKVGEVPADIPQVPLQRDLEARIRAARLGAAYRAEAASEKVLDLRKPAHLEASHLLHQLQVLGIPWGTLREQAEGKLGSFSESWRLEWAPDYLIGLIQASMWGNTVHAAASSYLLKQAGESGELSVLLALARQALLSGIIGVFGPLMARLEDAAALTQDVYSLMEALPVLAGIQRYGDTRQTDTTAVAQLIRHLVPRIAIGLPPAVLNVEEEVARDYFRQLVQGNRAISLLDEADYHAEWNRALRQISEAGPAHPLLRGLCSRILFDKSVTDADWAAVQLRYALSYAPAPEQAALWLEGFLYGSGLLLLHVPELWRLLDDWVAELPETVFEQVLPLIRRAFATFSAPEREKILRQARQSGPQIPEAEAAGTAFDQQRAKTVLPTLRLLLGME